MLEASSSSYNHVNAPPPQAEHGYVASAEAAIQVQGSVFKDSSHYISTNVYGEREWASIQNAEPEGPRVRAIVGPYSSSWVGYSNSRPSDSLASS